VVEDEPNLRQVLVIQIQRAGFEVLEASDGYSGSRGRRVDAPDLILLDVMMPGLDGYEVCRRLRGSYLTRHIPIIMLTARGEEDARTTGLEGGANDYLTKPWAKRELLIRITNALEWSRQQRSASPLTGLPGNQSINEELRQRYGSTGNFALLQLDIDNLQAVQ